MNDTLSFHNHLLAKGTHLVRLGQLSEGRELLQILLAGDDVPLVDRAKARCLLGDLEFAAGHFRNARRHFAAAMSLRPYDAEACLAYDRAAQADPTADPKKAVAACRRAVRIDPLEPRFWTALGQSAISARMPMRALKAFRKAARLRPENVDVLADLVDGFVALGKIEDAKVVLASARFRSPKNAALNRLWDRLRFSEARLTQESTRSESAEVAVLPFTTEVTSPGIVRADRRSRSKPHLLRMFGQSTTSRRAN